MNIDNDIWKIEDGRLLEYRGEFVNKIVVPEGVIEVKYGAFSRSNINCLVLPKSLKGFFINGSFIEKLIINSSNVLFGVSCTNITELEIYNDYDYETKVVIESLINGRYNKIKQITILGKNFSNCQVLKEINDLTIKNYIKLKLEVNRNGDFIICNNILTRYTGTATAKEVVIPEGVEIIDKYLFYNIGIVKVTLPESLKVIEECAFYACNLNEIYFPDNIEHVHDSAFSLQNLAKISISNSFKSIGVLRGIEELEIRGTSLRNINSNLIRTVKTLRIILNEEINDEELTNFYQKNQTELRGNYTIIVRNKNKEKTRYEFNDCSLKKLVIGSDLSHIDLDLIYQVRDLYIDNTDGKAIANFINFLKNNRAYKYYYDIVNIMGVPITRHEKKELNKLLGTFGGLFIRYNHIETEEYALKEKTTTQTLNVNAFDVEIKNQIEKINEIILDLNAKDKELVLKRVNNLLSEYKRSLEELKPKLSFDESSDFGIIYKTPKTLRCELLVSLETIINILNVDNIDTNLKSDLTSYDELKNKEVTLPENIITPLDKIKYIMVISHKWHNTSFMNLLENIVLQAHDFISNNRIKKIEEPILKIDISNFDFYKEIDNLYEKVKYFDLVETLFKDDKTSLLAYIIKNIREIINTFDYKNKEEYLRILDMIINSSYNKLKNNSDLDINGEISNINSKLQELLEKLKKYGGIYATYKDVIESLDLSIKDLNIPSVIRDTILDINILIEKLDDGLKEQVNIEVNKVIKKWQNFLLDNTYSYEELEVKINENVQALDRQAQTNKYLELQILITKELLDIKSNVVTYLNEVQEYEAISRGII